MADIFISTSSFAKVSQQPLDRLAAAGFEYRLNPFGRRLEATETADLLTGAVGLIAGTETLDRGVLEAADALRVISRCGSGLENIDLEAAAEREIQVFNTPDAQVDAVAELTLAAMLNLLRHVRQADAGVRAGRWDKPMGRLLRGKTVGIVGLGRIGRALARLLAPFDTQLLALDVESDKVVAEEHKVSYTTLETLLAESHIVSLHLPLTSATRGLIDRPALEAMRSGALLINCARGGLVDEDALASLLHSGHLGGAYLDVFESEPYDGPLIGAPNTLLTPHIGSYAAESRARMESEAVDNLLGFLRRGTHS